MPSTTRKRVSRGNRDKDYRGNQYEDLGKASGPKVSGATRPTAKIVTGSKPQPSPKVTTGSKPQPSVRATGSKPQPSRKVTEGSKPASRTFAVSGSKPPQRTFTTSASKPSPGFVKPTQKLTSNIDRQELRKNLSNIYEPSRDYYRKAAEAGFGTAEALLTSRYGVQASRIVENLKGQGRGPDSRPTKGRQKMEDRAAMGDKVMNPRRANFGKAPGGRDRWSGTMARVETQIAQGKKTIYHDATLPVARRAALKSPPGGRNRMSGAVARNQVATARNPGGRNRSSGIIARSMDTYAMNKPASKGPIARNGPMIPFAKAHPAPKTEAPGVMEQAKRGFNSALGKAKRFVTPQKSSVSVLEVGPETITAQTTLDISKYKTISFSPKKTLK